MENNNFKVHSICLVKNEADIIQHCLKEASKWSDYIYVYDGESTDGTWEKVLEISNEQIIPWKQDGKVFQEYLRGEVFTAFKHQAKPGDWWCHLDADEFYSPSPKDFLAKVSNKIHVVWGIAIEYYLASNDVDILDFSQPIEKLLPQIGSYKVENSEPRFFRHRDALTWDTGSWPKHVGIVNKERILYKHYKYRTPEQIQKRLETRVSNRERGFPGWEHAATANWKEKLVDSKYLHSDLKNGEYVIDFKKLPNHLEIFPRRTIKHIMHGLRVWP